MISIMGIGAVYDSISFNNVIISILLGYLLDMVIMLFKNRKLSINKSFEVLIKIVVCQLIIIFFIGNIIVSSIIINTYIIVSEIIYEEKLLLLIKRLIYIVIFIFASYYIVLVSNKVYKGYLIFLIIYVINCMFAFKTMLNSSVDFKKYICNFF